MNASNSLISPAFQTETGALSTLTFSNVFASQAGLYTCQGSVFSAQFGTTILNDTGQVSIQGI